MSKKERLRVSIRAALLITLQKTTFFYHRAYFYLHNLCGDFLFAEPVYDDMGRDTSNTKHAALGTPRHQLNGKWVLIHNLCAGFLLLTACLLKHLSRLQLVQHLEHYWTHGKWKSKEKIVRDNCSQPVIYTKLEIFYHIVI